MPQMTAHATIQTPIEIYCATCQLLMSYLSTASQEPTAVVA